MTKTKVKIVVEDGGIVPKKMTTGSAGYDLFCPKNTELKFGRGKIDLNIKLGIPLGIAGIIKPRSGFSIKGLLVLDIYGQERYIDCDAKDGVIDSDYIGIIGVIYENKCPVGHRVVPRGERIAQILFIKVEDVEFEEVDELEQTTRDGGFCSTGAK